MLSVLHLLPADMATQADLAEDVPCAYCIPLFNEAESINVCHGLRHSYARV